jgi:membrane protein implicated in regulation of membrane protease activity
MGGSTPTLLLYAGYVLIGGALLAPSLAAVRILIAGAALLWIGAALLHHELGTATMGGAVLALALAMIGRRLWENQSVRLATDEQAMVDTLFGELPRSRARHLLDQGVWLHGADGDV